MPAPKPVVYTMRRLECGACQHRWSIGKAKLGRWLDNHMIPLCPRCASVAVYRVWPDVPKKLVA